MMMMMIVFKSFSGWWVIWLWRQVAPGHPTVLPRKENITHNAMQLWHLTGVVGGGRLGAGWLVARHSGS